MRMDLSNLSKEELLIMVEKLSAENEEIKKKNELLEAEKRDLNIKLDKMIEKYENKLAINKKIQADRFAPKTEKCMPEEQAINEGANKKEKKPRKTPTENFINDLKELVNEVVVLDYDFELNGVSKAKKFRDDVSYKIEMVQSSFNVVKIIRPKYKDKEHFYQAQLLDPFPHSPLTPSLAASIITMKYQLFISLYRYSEYLKAHGLNISVYNLYHYVDRTIELLEPLYNELVKYLFTNSANVIHSDETTLDVIDSEKDKCYMFVYTTSFWDNPIYIYEFSETRKTEKLQKHLENYKGYLISDGYGGYNFHNKVQRCFVHVRRYFNDCLKPLSEKDKSKSPAYNAIHLINKLFKYESNFREEKLTASQIKERRNSEEYLNTIKELDDYILNIEETKNTLLIKAINYYKNMREELYTFLEDGHIDISNNLAERTVKPFVIARKNFLFCKTADGAIATGKAFSIVQTARANGLNVELYLKYAIESIDKVPIEDLLPWSKNLPDNLKIIIKK